MGKKDRILMLIEHFSGGNKSVFARKIGVTPQAITTWIARDTFDIETIYAKCEGIDANWLLSGEGSMLRTSVKAADDSLTVNSLIQMIREKDTQLLSQAKEIGRLETLLQRQGNDASIAGSLAPAPAV